MFIHSSPASRLCCVRGCESFSSDTPGWPPSLSLVSALPSAQPSRDCHETPGVSAPCQGARKPTNLFFLLPEPVRVHAPWHQGGQTPAHPRGAHRPGHNHLRLRGQVPEDPARGRHPWGMWLLILRATPSGGGVLI